MTVVTGSPGGIGCRYGDPTVKMPSAISILTLLLCLSLFSPVSPVDAQCPTTTFLATNGQIVSACQRATVPALVTVIASVCSSRHASTKKLTSWSRSSLPMDQPGHFPERRGGCRTDRRNCDRVTLCDSERIIGIRARLDSELTDRLENMHRPRSMPAGSVASNLAPLWRLWNPAVRSTMYFRGSRPRPIPYPP